MLLDNVINKLGKTKVLIIAIISILLLFSIIAFTYNNSSTRYQVLYNNLSQDNINDITSQLSILNIKYNLDLNQNSISVASDSILRARRELSKFGLPNNHSAKGYEIFDNQDIGVSNSVHNINKIRALEGELSRTIASFDKILSAKVHVVIPKKTLFNNDKHKTKTSVVLKLRDNSTLSKTQINAISHFILTSVPNINIENITIVDTKGRALKLGGNKENSLSSYMSSKKEDYKKSYETNVVSIITSMLEKIVGDGKVITKVSSEIDFDQVVINSEIYDPDSKVIRSMQVNEENESLGSSAEQAITIGNNLPNTNNQNNDSYNNKNERKSLNETMNYEISKTTKKHIKEVGKVNRLSVAVLVDGNYIEDDEGKLQYVKRSDEELESFKVLIKSAIGFNEDRGDSLEIINHKFIENNIYNTVEEKKPFLNFDAHDTVKASLIAVITIIIIIFILKPIVNKVLEISQNSADELLISSEDINNSKIIDMLQENNDLEEDESINDNLEYSNNNLINQLNKVAQNDPKLVVNIIRDWLYR